MTYVNNICTREETIWHGPLRRDGYAEYREECGLGRWKQGQARGRTR